VPRDVGVAWNLNALLSRPEYLYAIEAGEVRTEYGGHCRDDQAVCVGGVADEGGNSRAFAGGVGSGEMALEGDSHLGDADQDQNEDREHHRHLDQGRSPIRTAVRSAVVRARAQTSPRPPTLSSPVRASHVTHNLPICDCRLSAAEVLTFMVSRPIQASCSLAASGCPRSGCERQAPDRRLAERSRPAWWCSRVIRLLVSGGCGE